MRSGSRYRWNDEITGGPIRPAVGIASGWTTVQAGAAGGLLRDSIERRETLARRPLDEPEGLDQHDDGRVGARRLIFSQTVDRAQCESTMFVGSGIETVILAGFARGMAQFRGAAPGAVAASKVGHGWP